MNSHKIYYINIIFLYVEIEGPADHKDGVIGGEETVPTEKGPVQNEVASRYL
jgi:hypothetical protein